MTTQQSFIEAKTGLRTVDMISAADHTTQFGFFVKIGKYTSAYWRGDGQRYEDISVRIDNKDIANMTDQELLTHFYEKVVEEKRFKKGADKWYL